jgi:ABC-type taurine transport system ATPase subunit
MLHGGAKQRIGMLALALEPNLMVNSISMSW